MSGDWAPEGGQFALAEHIQDRFGTGLLCATCRKPAKGNSLPFNRDQGGKPPKGYEKRRQWRCRTVANNPSSGFHCSVLTCQSYIRRAAAVLGEDVVEAERKKIYRRLQEDEREHGQIRDRFAADEGATTVEEAPAPKRETAKA